MKEWKGTKGECFSIKREHPAVHGATLTDIKSRISLPNGLKKSIGTINATQKEEGIANVELVVDAFNTINKCGIMPSELLEQRNQLIGVLQTIDGYSNATIEMPPKMRDAIKEATSKCTGK